MASFFYISQCLAHRAGLSCFLAALTAPGRLGLLDIKMPLRVVFSFEFCYLLFNHFPGPGAGRFSPGIHGGS